MLLLVMVVDGSGLSCWLLILVFVAVEMVLMVVVVE